MKTSRYFSLLFVLTLFIPVLLINMASATSTTISINPQDSYTTVGNNVNVDVNVTNVVNLTSWQFIVYFSNHILSCTTVTEGPFLKTSGGSTFFGMTITNDYNDTYGRVLAYSTLLGNYLVSGGGVLATITFSTVASGDSSVHLSDTRLGDQNIPPLAITHTDVDGTVHVSSGGLTNLIVDGIVVQNQGCNVYANDTYANSSPYYVPVQVDVKNVGTMAAGSFNMSLSAYWLGGSLQENYVEWRVSSLSAGANTTLTFSWHPIHTGYYNLTATADCHNEITESNEGDNTLVQASYPVALMGDIKGDHTVNILDASVISLAWGTHSGDAAWNIKADLNHDGVISILDGVRVTVNWNLPW